MADEHVTKRKLSDNKKDILIEVFEKSKPLWSSGSQFRDKEEKDSQKVNFFDKKYTVSILEKTFHDLRTAFIREHKKNVEGKTQTVKTGNFMIGSSI